ncbi:hypothetical protein [Candidatus Protofrankia datiscae]|uniref:Uncharacterized protein n=1 Tax=Candidatus Protofrankia datiscae TaxID=2716812 RepID=F8B2M2_9ACTN|nr:hypothetical protein [Candidatus Protofrankia datiscae]AEH08829.1 hypothetical protein FsymDg_1349 [Candidatus Protofrankia datiscae]
MLAVAAALATRTRPVPDEAAAVASRAVALPADRPTSSVAAKAWEIAVGLARWQDVTEVREYHDQVRVLSARLVLPGGSR